ncbi:MAG: hypothetical protein OEM46_02735 [Ignavibacteria bacterium]|nr:hypothetical protein [Ignavibacteria bacterium]
MNARIKICFFSSLLILQACDIFESREPESPNETKSSYRVPVEPPDVIENIKNSFKDKNANDYKKNFSSGSPLVDRNFYFFPSSNVLNIFPTDWTIAQEFQYFNNLVIRVPQSIPIVLSFSDEQYELQADSAVYSAKYFISVPVQNSAPVIYEGNLRFLMSTDINAAWVIYYWEDIATQNSKSWSELKIEFYL